MEKLATRMFSFMTPLIGMVSVEAEYRVNLIGWIKCLFCTCLMWIKLTILPQSIRARTGVLELSSTAQIEHSGVTGK